METPEHASAALPIRTGSVGASGLPPTGKGCNQHGSLSVTDLTFDHQPLVEGLPTHNYKLRSRRAALKVGVKAEAVKHFRRCIKAMRDRQLRLARDLKASDSDIEGRIERPREVSTVAERAVDYRHERLRLATAWFSGEHVSGREWADLRRRRPRAENYEDVLRYGIRLIFTAAGYHEFTGLSQEFALSAFAPVFDSTPPQYLWSLLFYNSSATAVYDQVLANMHFSREQFERNLAFRYSALPWACISDGNRYASALRLLLIIAGVEPNPGPPRRDAQQAQPAAQAAAAAPRPAQAAAAPPDAEAQQRRALNIVRPGQAQPQPRGNPGGQRGGQRPRYHRGGNNREYARNMINGFRQDMQAEADGLRERNRELERQAAVRQEEHQVREGELLEQLRQAQQHVDQAVHEGFRYNEDAPMRVFAFHGRFVRGFQCTFNDGSNEDGVVDPIVTVNVFADGHWTTNADGHIHSLQVSPSMLQVASRSVMCATKTARMRNIFNGLQVCSEIKEEIKHLASVQIVDYMLEIELIAFVLTGLISTAGTLRWINDCEEWVFDKYVITQLPDDAEDRLAPVHFAADTLKFQASTATNARAAPFVIDGHTPGVPDSSDFTTLCAGMLKRMYPKTTKRSEEVLNDLFRIATDLTREIRQHISDEDNVPKRDLLETSLKGRPAHEALQIIEGFEDAEHAPQAAIARYNTFPYKCFIKLEAYPFGSMKPPRFIQSLDPWCRGVQIFFMARILHLIEVGTRRCNVKGLRPDEITEALKLKFATMDLVAESDYSAFEASVGPDLKNVVENQIFLDLAADDSEREFIVACLCRDEVNVIGPCFTIPHYHHIRMSGDLWTSIGNLLTNIVISAYANRMDVSHLMDVGLFEGDDGAYPAPADPAAVVARAKQAGMILELAIAPWESLSFCGNNFTLLEDGSLLRFRDPLKAAANATVLFNAPRSTRKHDLMLQRSKVICYLQYPVVPDAFVFFCVVERFTRDYQVDADLLLRMGHLKEWGGAGLERCVPDWLVHDSYGSLLSDRQFVNLVYERNRAAGGHCPKSRVWDMVKAVRAADGNYNHVVLPSPFDHPATGAWFARDGSRFTHVDSFMGFKRIAVNDKYTEPAYALITHQPRIHTRACPEEYVVEQDRNGRRFTARLSWSDLMPAFSLLFVCMALFASLFFVLYADQASRLDHQAHDFTSYDPTTGLPYSVRQMCVFKYERYEPEVYAGYDSAKSLEDFLQLYLRPLDTSSLPRLVFTALMRLRAHIQARFEFYMPVCSASFYSLFSSFRFLFLSTYDLHDVDVFLTNLVCWFAPGSGYEPSLPTLLVVRASCAVFYIYAIFRVIYFFFSPVRRWSFGLYLVLFPAAIWIAMMGLGLVHHYLFIFLFPFTLLIAALAVHRLIEPILRILIIFFFH